MKNYYHNIKEILENKTEKRKRKQLILKIKLIH